MNVEPEANGETAEVADVGVADATHGAGSVAGAGADSPRGGSIPIRGSLVLAAVWVVVDQLTKHWAVNHLSDRDIDLVGSLRFHLHHNSGMAFGRGTGIGPVLGVFAFLMVCGLLISLRKADSRMSAIGVGLVLGGAVGNLLDRLFRGDGWLRGAVVDFIDPQWWPIFNVADIGVTCGAILLVLGSLLVGRSARKGAA